MERRPAILLIALIGVPAAVALIGGAIALAVMATVMTHSGGHSHDSTAPGSLVDPVVVQPRQDIADFVLTDQDGRPFRLSGSNGGVRLIYIGYTNCPDLCPTTMVNFKNVKRALGPQAYEVTFVMITADPDRDTPTVMKQFLSSFDPAFVGLSGSADQLRQVWNEFGASIGREDDPQSAAGYAVTHPSSVFVLDRDGRVAMKIPYLRPPADVAGDIRTLLQ
jgi:protein SCO1/2